MEFNAVELKTKQLEAQRSFYTGRLGFPLLQQTSHSFSIQTGYTVIFFIEDKNATPYHFAFNIPAHQEQEAAKWLRARTTLLKDGQTEIVDFSGLDAKAVYFYDADQNIVEFISRRRIAEHRDLPFSTNSILGLSEIVMVADNISSVFETLEANGVEIFDGNMLRFCAVGNDTGLFIIINPNVKKWFSTDERAHSVILP